MTRLAVQFSHRFDSGFSLDIAFEAGDGLTALFGPSGCGKTTTLSVIAGTLKPTAGVVTFDDRAWLDTARRVALPPERRGVGVVFQDDLLFPHLTVEKNLLYGRRGGAKSIDPHRVIAVLELTGLLRQYPSALSGGERRRVALGRALLREPMLLLLDEPLSGLDAPLRRRVMVYLERILAEWRLPTLLVSHEQAEVRRLADRIVMIESGRVVATGPTASTLDASPASLPLNLLRVTDIRQTGSHWEGRVGELIVQLPHSLPTSSGVVQFQPTDVILAAKGATGLSVRNRWPGRVREIVEREGQALVAIELEPNVPLWAEVTPDAVKELALQPGTAVVCLVKTTALTLTE